MSDQLKPSYPSLLQPTELYEALNNLKANYTGINYKNPNEYPVETFQKTLFNCLKHWKEEKQYYISLVMQDEAEYGALCKKTEALQAQLDAADLQLQGARELLGKNYTRCTGYADECIACRRACYPFPNPSKIETHRPECLILKLRETLSNTAKVEAMLKVVEAAKQYYQDILNSKTDADRTELIKSIKALRAQEQGGQSGE